MFERFTDRARKLIVLAQQEADRSGQRRIGTEHILLALLEEQQSKASRILIDRGVTRESLIPVISDLPELEPVDEADGMRFTIDAKTVFSLGYQESSALGHEFVAPEHILLGLLADVEGDAAKVMSYTADSVGRIRQEVIKAISGDGSKVCTKCGASIEEFGKVQPLDLDVEQGEPIKVFAYFCGECRSTYGLVRGKTDD